jgi:hypothetical protein
MSQRRVLRGLPVFSAVVAGVLGGHWAAYALSFDQGRRHEALASSGHAYLPLAAKFSVVLVLAAAGAVLLRHLDSARTGGPTRDADPFGLAARLCTLQLALFAAMEVTERLAASAPLEGLLHDHLLLLGVVTQLVCAAIGALALLLLHRAAARLVAEMRFRFRAPRPDRLHGMLPARSQAIPAPLLLAGAGGLRGPPHP